MLTYTHFQYIAYQVPTVSHNNNYGDRNPADYISKIPVDDLQEPNPENLHGNFAGLSRDALSRVRRFIGALELAHNRLADTVSGNDAYTLKIFIAPEFYFRPNNDNSAYEEEEYECIKSVLKFTIHNSNRFKNWLIVAGTIMWRKPISVGVYAYLNTALVIKRGLTTTKMYAIEKTDASSFDGLGGDPLSEFQLQHQTLESRKQHVFEHWGIHFGLEICFEHKVQNGTGLLKLLINSWEKRGLLYNYKQPIDIHLLISGGMSIINRNVVAKTGGYILKNDGLLSKNRSLQVNQCKVIRYTNGDIETSYDNIPSKAILVPNPTPHEISNPNFAIKDRALCSNADSIDLNAEHPLFMVSPDNSNNDYWFPQRIKIYNRKML